MYTSLQSRFFAVVTVALLGATLWMGCADSMIGTEDMSETPALAASDGSKFRHAHLMDRAVKPSVASVGKGADNNGNHLGLIMGVGNGLDKQRIAERYRVSNRYKVADRYKVAVRYEYTDVFEGLAIEVEDSLGTEDFEEFLDSLEADLGVVWYEPDVAVDIAPTAPVAEPGTGAQVTPWNVDRVGGIGQSARGVEVFILDTGVSNDDVNVVESVDFTNSASSTSDIDGHGTHIAGTIAAYDDGDDVVGLAPGTRIRSLKVLPDVDPNPDDPDVDLSTAIAAVEYATGQKLANPNVPMVVNMSLGADVGTSAYNALDEAIAASSAAGVVYVVSAGNEGIDAATVTPAHTVEAITVGAYDDNDVFAWFSNYGAIVDILAPGVDALSLDTEADGNAIDPVKMSGTSMAAAHVAGAVALFLGQNPQASPAQVRDALVASGLARITGVPQGTTDKTIHIGDLMEVQLSPFYHYAIASDDDLKIEAPITVVYDGLGSVNANLFSNHHIDLRVDGVTVEGFGYARDDVKPQSRADAAFQPRLNPTNLPAYQEDLDRVAIPDFRPEDYEHLATQRSSGDVNLSGHYTLGTVLQPMVWYIDGKLKTESDVSFSGYGILLVKEDVEMKHNVTIQGLPDDTNIGIYTGKKFKVRKDAGQVTLMGHLVAREEVVVEGDLQLTGSITSGQQVEFKPGAGSQGASVIRYRPPSPILLDMIWPMNSSNQRLGTSSMRRLISRW